MTHGYLYCFSNESMPGLLKVGMTERKPEIRLIEANRSDTWRPPTPYKIEVAKKVLNPKQKETTLHNLLSQYTERINPKREFFRVSPEEVKTFFDLIDGDLWLKTPEEKEKEKEEAETEEETEEDYQLTISKLSLLDKSHCFQNGQRIRHTIGINRTWVGIYDSTKNRIIYERKCYSSAKVLEECECEVNGIWIPYFPKP